MLANDSFDKLNSIQKINQEHDLIFFFLADFNFVTNNVIHVWSTSDFTGRHVIIYFFINIISKKQ